MNDFWKPIEYPKNTFLVAKAIGYCPFFLGYEQALVRNIATGYVINSERAKKNPFFKKSRTLSVPVSSGF